MKLYEYDSRSNEYIKTVESSISSFTKEIIIPGNTTKVKLPKILKNKVAVFNKATNKWVLKQDHRDKILTHKITGERLAYNEIGPIPKEYTNVSIPSELPNIFYKFDSKTKTWIYNNDKLIEFKIYYTKLIKSNISDYINNYNSENSQRTLLLLVSEGNIEAIRLWNWIKKNLSIMKLTISKVKSKRTIASILNIKYDMLPFTGLKKLMDII